MRRHIMPFPAPLTDFSWMTRSPDHVGGVSSWMTLSPYAEAAGNVVGEAPVFWSIELYVTPFDHREDLISPEGSRGERSERGTDHRLRDWRVRE